MSKKQKLSENLKIKPGLHMIRVLDISFFCQKWWTHKRVGVGAGPQEQFCWAPTFNHSGMMEVCAVEPTFARKEGRYGRSIIMCVHIYINVNVWDQLWRWLNAIFADSHFFPFHHSSSLLFMQYYILCRKEYYTYSTSPFLLRYVHFFAFDYDVSFWSCVPLHKNWCPASIFMQRFLKKNC